MGLAGIGSAIGGIAGSLLGQKVEQGNQKALIDQQEKLQKQFAKQGIQWRVKDARKAGIHPLYALGAQTASYTPQQVGGSTGGGALAAMGQDILGSVNRSSSRADRAFNTQQRAMALERMGLENELLRTQIASTASQQASPAIPAPTDRYLIDGQGDTNQSGLVVENPLRRTRSEPGVPSSEPGAIVDYGFVRTPTGWAPVMGKDTKERYEEDPLGMLTWNLRNRILPRHYGGSMNTPNVPLRGMEHWVWVPELAEWQKRVPKPSRRPSRARKPARSVHPSAQVGGLEQDYGYSSPSRRPSRRPSTPRGW